MRATQPGPCEGPCSLCTHNVHRPRGESGSGEKPGEKWKYRGERGLEDVAPKISYSHGGADPFIQAEEQELRQTPGTARKLSMARIGSSEVTITNRRVVHEDGETETHATTTHLSF
jgi:hypothetical protein